MKLVGAGGQQVQHPLYDASGAVLTANTPQLVLARSLSRCFLSIQNLSANTLYFEIGSARALATVFGGVVTGFTITNAGFGFTHAPLVRLEGGGNAGNSSYLGLNQPGAASPSHPAMAHCVLTAGAVSSIVIDDPGAGYVVAPYVYILNSDLDPFGCAIPSVSSGIALASGGPPFVLNGTACTTDQIAVFAPTTANDAFSVKWMD